MITTTSLL